MDFPRGSIPVYRRMASAARQLFADWQIIACFAVVILACGGVALILAARSLDLADADRNPEQPIDGEPTYTATGELLRPEGVERWVFVGASIGLGYAESASTNDFFHNVYIIPKAYEAFMKTRTFPERTMLALDVREAGEGVTPARRGRFEGRHAGFEIAVKDAARFSGGWAYFAFASGRKSAPPSGPICLACHAEHAATDHVFTQFYPLLRDGLPQ